MGQTEIDDADPSVGADQHVVGLEVAVHDPRRVRRGEAAPGLDDGPEQRPPVARLLILGLGVGLLVSSIAGLAAEYCHGFSHGKLQRCAALRGSIRPDAATLTIGGAF